MAVQIQLRRDSAADWTSANPTLAQGEVGHETDTNKIKIGDGVTAWTSLAYFKSGIGTATASGTDTYTATISGVTAYATHDIYEIIFTNANTGSSTININALGAKTLKKSVSTNLASGDITAGQSFFIVYDGTNFQVIGLGGGSGSGTVNSGTQYRIAYYATTGTAISEASAITAARALKSDANGVPTHFDTATEPSLTELSYVKGVTSAIQTQINALTSGGVWVAMPTVTRTDGDTFTIPDTSNAGNWDKKLDRLRVIKWTDTTTHMAIVKSSSYATNVVTVEIAGDTLDSSATMTSFYYTTIPATRVRFPKAGNVYAATNISMTFYADCAYRVLMGRANHGTAGTTNATTYDINKNGSTIFTTKLSVSSGDLTGDDTTADNDTSLALDDYVTVDCDSNSATYPIDAYVDLYIFPTNNVFL